MKVGADTVWVLVTAMLVFFMNLGFASVESGFCRAKNAVNILSKNFIVFAVTTFFFWMLGWGIMFGNGTPYFGKEGLVVLERGRQQPCHGRCLRGRLRCDQLDGRAAGGEILLPAGVRRHGRHDCFRRRCRAHQVYFVHRVQRADGDCRSIRSSATGFGAAVGWPRRAFLISPARRRCIRSAAGPHLLACTCLARASANTRPTASPKQFLATT